MPLLIFEYIHNMYYNKLSSESVYTVTAERFTNTVLDFEQKWGIYNICFKIIYFFFRYKKTYLYVPYTHNTYNITAKYLTYIRFIHADTLSNLDATHGLIDLRVFNILWTLWKNCWISKIVCSNIFHSRKCASKCR